MSERALSPGESSGPFIELCDLHKRFGSNRVLCGVDLAIDPGEIFTILGGSGSGKSVMMKHMVGLLRPDRGRVLVEGRDVTGLTERQWVGIRTQVGYVFQGAALFDSLSAYENVAYALREHRRDWSEERIRERVAACLEAVGLTGVEGHMPAELSGGMRKRLGVARAIALEPKAILYDEPTTGLDPSNARRIGELICELRERLRVTSVVVTHEMDLCFAISDRIVLLKGGRIVATGTPEQIQGSTQADVREFLEGGYDSVRDVAHDAAGQGELHGR